MYIKASNGVFEKFYSIGQLRKDNPQTSFPKNPSNELLADWGVFPVKPTPGPSVDYTKNIKEGGPVKQGDEWVQVWEVTDATPEEIADRTEQQKRSMREQRAQAYKEESDPLFFKAQRGEATMEEWLAKVEEIKQRFPYQE